MKVSKDKSHLLISANKKAIAYIGNDYIGGEGMYKLLRITFGSSDHV